MVEQKKVLDRRWPSRAGARRRGGANFSSDGVKKHFSFEIRSGIIGLSIGERSPPNRGDDEMKFLTTNPRLTLENINMGAGLTRIDLIDKYKGAAIATIRPLDLKDDEGRQMYSVETKSGEVVKTFHETQKTINRLIGKRPA
jgi:hypothetical protein